MPTGDIITDIIYDLLISVTAEELRELLHKILNGDDLEHLALSGDVAAQSLTSGIVDAGLDPSSLTQTDWAQFDAAMGAGADSDVSTDFSGSTDDSWDDPMGSDGL